MAASSWHWGDHQSSRDVSIPRTREPDDDTFSGCLASRKNQQGDEKLSRKTQELNIRIVEPLLQDEDPPDGKPSGGRPPGGSPPSGEPPGPTGGPPPGGWELLRALGFEISAALETCVKYRAPTDDDEIDGDNRNGRVRARLKEFASCHPDVIRFRRERGEAFVMYVEGFTVVLCRQDGSIPGMGRRHAPTGQLSLFVEGPPGRIVLEYDLTSDGACRRVKARLLDLDGLVELASWVIWTPVEAGGKQVAANPAAHTRDVTSPVDDFRPKVLKKPGDGEPNPD